MASRGPNPRLAHLWQAPLLLVSVGLFAAAAYLFINPGGGMTIDQKIDVARLYLQYNRPDAALDQLNKLVTTEKLTQQSEAKIHLLLGESLEAAQKEHRLSLASNYQRIIEQTRQGIAQGGKADADTYRRLAESYEALGKSPEALESYRRAMAMDPRKSPNLQRKIIELQLAQSDTAPAEASIEDYLKDEKLSNSERGWGLREKAQLLSKRGDYSDAKAMLDESLRLDTDPIAQGEAHFRLGVCTYRMGDASEAERLLRAARDQLKVGHPLDAEAAYLLGKIRQEQNDPKEAISFYHAVLMSHPESDVAVLARLGRGQCRIVLGDDAAGLTDMHDLVSEISEPAHKKHLPEIMAGLKQSAAILAAQEKYQGALELLAYEQSLQSGPPDADFYSRLAVVYEKRSDQVERTVAESPNPAEKIRRQDQVRALRTRAGDAYIALSRALTVSDDKAHAEAMWKGVDLYDRAGNLQMVTSALELFAAERPDDGQTPDALLRLGRAYQAAGMFDKAISAFERNQLRYPQSLAASKSGVPLAEALMAKGPENNERAEKVLLAVVENNPNIGPDAEEFGQALLELSQLYYRTGRYEEAIVRLSEMTQRYPQDPRMPQLVFLMGDSYRKSAAALKEKLKDPKADPAEIDRARRERLNKAKAQYDRLVDMYHDSSPAGDSDKLYLKLAYFYRADCLYDLGEYDKSIALYDQAATRYQDDASALSALVQIVNANCELGRFEEAKRANERARTLLARMPDRAFSDGSFSMPKSYWAQWLSWTNNAGIWTGLEDARQAAQKFANTGSDTNQ